jgi:putative DNA primase/helicase
MTTKTLNSVGLFAHLWRGGKYAYYWTASEAKDGAGGALEKITTWFDTGAPWPDLPADSGRHGARHIYFSVNPTNERGSQYQRAKDGERPIVAINTLFAEFDLKQFGSRDATLDHINGMQPAPSVIIFSGGGYHAYYLLNEPFLLVDEANYNRAKFAQRAWVVYTNGDDATKDLNRVLRVPGTRNYKAAYGPDFPTVEIVKADFDVTYTLDFLESRAKTALPPARPPHPTNGNHNTAPGDDLETARNCLKRLAGWRCDQYQSWLDVGMSLDALGEFGLSLWDEWSRQSAKYTPGECEKKWATFNGHGLTLASLVYWANEDNPQPRVKANEPQASPTRPRGALLDGGPTDEANAQALVKLYPGRFLNCTQLSKSNQPGWMHYNGRYWEAEQAPETLERSIVSMLIARCKAAMDAGTDPNTGKFIEEQLVKFCTPNANKIQSCKVNLRSIITADITDFDNDRDFLNCQNGVVNLRDGTIIPHDPGQRFTYCIPVDYKPAADFSAWQAWLRDTLGGDSESARYVQMAVGYSLTGHTSEECLFYVHGPTRSGKGTFSETLLKLLGNPLAAGVDFVTFTEKRSGDSQNFDLAGLKAARFVVASESNKYQFLNPRRIKSITGGDMIRCAHKHGPFFEYFPAFKIWLLSNEPVRGDSEDDALWSRVNVISFPNSHLGHEDKQLKRKMLEPANLEAVLAWAIAGAIAWYSAPDGLQKPAKVASVTQQQRDGNDFSQQFMDDCLTPAPDAFLPNPVLSAVYKGWCEAHSLTPKERKVQLTIGKHHMNCRQYVNSEQLKNSQYGRVITLAAGYDMQQFRGYDGLMITEDVLNEYL